MTTTTKTVKISVDMFAALTSEHNNNGDSFAKFDGTDYRTTRGNVAAHAYNVTAGGGLEGINLGWRDQEASTDFLCEIVEAVDELWSDMNETDDEGNIYGNVVHAWDALSDRAHEIADNAVPVYNRERVDAALELGAEVDEAGLLPDTPTLADVAGVALYELATQVVWALMGALISNDEDSQAVES